MNTRCVNRIATCCVGAALLGAATTLPAQQPTWRTCTDGGSCAPRGLTRLERDDAQALYNAPATRREQGPFSLARDSVIRGSLAVLGGPVRLAGTVEGSVLILNGDLELVAGAQITGKIAVLGGRVTGVDSARTGAIRAEPDSVRYTVDDGALALEAPFDEIWRLIGAAEPRQGIGLRLAAAKTYNRVEGLAIEYGPRLRYRTRFGTVAADAFGIFRTGDKLEWIPDNLGHTVRVDLRLGQREHVSIGGRLYDVVAPVEDWHLTDVEVGLAAFIGHSDYRDYYNRQGASGVLGWRDGRATRLQLEVGHETWAPRRTLDPISLWKNDDGWRANPAMDRAYYTRAQLRGSYDTRTDPVRPRSGWWLQGEYEYADGDHVTYGTELSVPTPRPRRSVHYGRGFLDLRRYTRLSRSAQLNARLVLGGWLHGDPLPLQRRLSLSGPGANTGFAFRQAVARPDGLQCHELVVLPGSPALCDRVALLSMDYRHDISWLVDLFAGSRLVQPDRSGYAGWVLFGDLGRGWLKNPRTELPPVFEDPPRGLNSLQTSAGFGLELGQGGIYVAKALGAPPSRGVQVYVRLARRY